VYKRINHQSVAFKLSLLLVFSALFFVQSQVRFIECAYGAYSNASFSASFAKHASSRVQLNKNTNNNDNAFVKLSKRYPVYNAFTVSSALQIIILVFTLAFLKFFYREPFITGNVSHAFFLRGPPTLRLHSSLLL